MANEQYRPRPWGHHLLDRVGRQLQFMVVVINHFVCHFLDAVVAQLGGASLRSGLRFYFALADTKLERTRPT
jgi:hypothetical protein